MLVIKFILLVFSVFVGYTLGYLFTEKYNIGKYDIFNFEAFKCRQCLSFHISWVTSTIMSLFFNDWIMLLFGISFALLLYLGIRKDQNNKIITLEEYDEL